MKEVLSIRNQPVENLIEIFEMQKTIIIISHLTQQHRNLFEYSK
jgi:ABC-type phosphate transport system ATPase subunit